MSKNATDIELDILPAQNEPRAVGKTPDDQHTPEPNDDEHSPAPPDSLSPPSMPPRVSSGTASHPTLQHSPFSKVTAQPRDVNRWHAVKAVMKVKPKKDKENQSFHRVTSEIKHSLHVHDEDNVSGSTTLITLRYACYLPIFCLCGLLSLGIVIFFCLVVTNVLSENTSR